MLFYLTWATLFISVFLMILAKFIARQNVKRDKQN